MVERLDLLGSALAMTVERPFADPEGARPVDEERSDRRAVKTQVGGEIFDESVASFRAALEGADDAHLMQPWTLLSGGEELFTLPRMGVLRGMIINHIIHHRAQLGVYLRLNDVPVPATYGPSADEGMM